MAVIAFCSAKGGVGKTTMAVNIAAEIAARGTSCAIVDCDLNQHATQFGTAFMKNCPELPLFFLGKTNKNNIIENIKVCSERASVTIVDLPAGTSELSLRAVMKSHLVVIPAQRTVLDAKDALRTTFQISEASDLSGRLISSLIIWSMVSNKFETRTEKFVRNSLNNMLSDAKRAISPTPMMRYDIFQASFAYGFIPRQVAENAGKELALSEVQSGRKDGVSFFVPQTAPKAAENISDITDILLSRLGDIAKGQDSYIAINKETLDKMRANSQEMP